MLSTVASIPFAMVGAGVAAWGWVTRQVPYLDGLFGGRSGPYRQVPIDDDGELFRSVLDCTLQGRKLTDIAEVLGRYDDD
jgi:hypothetical protein